MTRDEAQAEVAQHVQMIGQFQAVAHADALLLLGNDRCARLLADRIRCLGPVAGFVYPWNVADYLYQPNLGRKLMQCPSCRGTKKLIGLFPKYADEVPQEERKAAIEFDCDRCEGAGEVPAEMTQWIAVGKKLKAERMKGGMGLREFCQSNGIDVMIRSKRERGCIDPATPDQPHEWCEPAQV